jgi:topoisomerase-4 subunit A
VPGPDYPGGGQIISSASDIADAYRTGRGSLKVRARWKIEDLARGQWQLVVTELPPGVSTQKVLEEIEELTNPRSRPARRRCRRTRCSSSRPCCRCWTRCATSRARTPPCAWCSSPRPAASSNQELITTLLAHTSAGARADQPHDGRPRRQAGAEVAAADAQRVDRLPPAHHRAPLAHRLDKVLDRIHILEGRQLVLLNIDEVIAIIRAADEPKQALIARFNLSERQAEDILEIRLRQLARLEAIKIEQELKACAKSRRSWKTSWAARPRCAG